MTLEELEYGPEILTAVKAWQFERLPEYTRYRNYYNGKHDMRYVSDKFQEVYGSLFRKFADNMCRKVVDVPKSRTILEGIEGSPDADEWFRANRVDGVQRVLHRDAYLYGDAYLILWDKGEGVKPYRNSPEFVTAVYDESDPGKMLAAIKMWRVQRGKDKITRLTVYYADRAERYFSVTGEGKIVDPAKENWTEFTDDGNFIHDHDLGVVPVFHFANKAGPGEFGISELADVIALQDALNKSCFDMLVNSEATSMAQRYVTGLTADINPVTGEPINPFQHKELWMISKEDAKIGQLPAGDSQQLLSVVRNWREEIGVVAGIPIYYIHPDAGTSSGVALQVIEAPLRDKIGEAQVLFGNIWEDIFGAAIGAEPGDLNAIWRDTAPVSEGERLDNALKKKAVGYSRSAILRSLGMNDEAIKQNQTEKTDEDAQDIAKAQQMMTRDPFGNVDN